MVRQDDLVARYQKYFNNWDESAVVRSKSNQYRISECQLKSELRNKKWFLPTGVPILIHPLLQGIDHDQEQYLLGRFLLQFLEYGTILEHEFVNTILVELALGECGIPLPDCMRLDAFKIYTDEAYHAYFNFEATQHIRNYIGLQTADAWPLKNSRLSAMRELIPQDDRDKNLLVRLGIAIVSETVAAKELAESLQGIIVDPIYNLFIDHAEDEKKHCMYFSTLLEVIWNFLSLEDKKNLSMYFPKILKTFVSINTISLFEALEGIGIDRESSEAIIKDSYPEDFNVKRALSVATVTFRSFERLGIYNIPGVREEFFKEGFTMVV